MVAGSPASSPVAGDESLLKKQPVSIGQAQIIGAVSRDRMVAAGKMLTAIVRQADLCPGGSL
jgi:hypothetical protein